VIVNFKGYVGNLQNNTGEDRGYVIHTGRDLWKRYSLGGEGKQYQVIVLHGETQLGRLFVRLTDPVFDYVILQVSREVKRCLFPGDSLAVSSKEPIKILDIKTNIPRNAGVQAFLKGRDINAPLFFDGEAFPWGSGSRDNGHKERQYRIVVQREHIILGSIFLNLEEGRFDGG